MDLCFYPAPTSPPLFYAQLSLHHCLFVSHRLSVTVFINARYLSTHPPTASVSQRSSVRDVRCAQQLVKLLLFLTSQDLGPPGQAGGSVCLHPSPDDLPPPPTGRFLFLSSLFLWINSLLSFQLVSILKCGTRESVCACVETCGSRGRLRLKFPHLQWDLTFLQTVHEMLMMSAWWNICL